MLAVTARRVEEPELTAVALSRSEQMSRVSCENTAPERRVLDALSLLDVSFDAHRRTPVGKPDVVLNAERVAVFIDGCFWHGCPTHYVRPTTRAEFWAAKLLENTTRDREQTSELEALGWRVVRVWEHEVFTDLDAVIARIERAIGGQQPDEDEAWRVERVDEIDRSCRIERRFLVSLRPPRIERTVDGRRNTTKWKAPRSIISQPRGVVAPTLGAPVRYRPR